MEYSSKLKQLMQLAILSSSIDIHRLSARQLWARRVAIWWEYQIPMPCLSYFCVKQRNIQVGVQATYSMDLCPCHYGALHALKGATYIQLQTYFRKLPIKKLHVGTRTVSIRLSRSCKGPGMEEIGEENLWRISKLIIQFKRILYLEVRRIHL